MTRRNTILCVPTLICALFSVSVHANEQDSEIEGNKRPLQRLQAKSELKMHELEFAVSEHAIAEAELEISKAKANLRSLQSRVRSGKHDEQDRIEYATLEVKQAQIRAEMKQLHSKMKQVELELARARFDHLGLVLNRTPVPVQFEVVDDLDAIVIRGSREGVEKIKSLIERNANK